MLLATVVLSAALSPALPVTAAPQEEPAPPLTFEGIESPEAPPAEPAEPAVPPALEASEMPAVPASAVQTHLEAGHKAFIRGRFSRAREEFEKAYEADPQSAATAFYLGYACYKIGEPSARMNADKQRARELFAKAYQLDPAFQPVWGRKKE